MSPAPSGATPPRSPAQRLVDLGGDVALIFGVWFASVVALNFLVGSPLTEIYVGLSIVGAAWWAAWKAARLFDDPPHAGAVRLETADGPCVGTVAEEGRIDLSGPDGRPWSGTAWQGRWTLTDADGVTWHGSVDRRGRVHLSTEDGRTMEGTLAADGEGVA